jgi:lipoate-protein ligase A
MKYIETGSCSPAVNLAYEEYFLKGKDLEEDLFMLWRNEPAIVVGRFQNTLVEINSSFAEAHQIQVIRRISGGGTVYHDLGNLCFSFILHDVKPEIIDKSKYVRPLVDALSRLAIQTEVTGRNDLTIGGKKIS